MSGRPWYSVPAMWCSVHRTEHICVSALAGAAASRLKAVARAFLVVSSTPRYVLFAAVSAASLLVLSVYLSMGAFVPRLLVSDVYDAAGKATILIAALGNFRTNFSVASEIITIVIAVLGGFNVAMSVYIFRRRVASGVASGAGVVGTLAGMLGAGCSACGSVLLSSLLGTGATASVVGVLPFGGHAFGIIGILVLATASVIIAPNVVHAPVCSLRLAKRP